ncbi:MAG TPA: imidazolonepropionase [Burkholderiaceae bacterium]|nr:imidazolonepropionase [Burkholderiaceae bacterium]
MTAPLHAVPQLWRNARLATLSPALPGLGVIERGALAVRDGRIAYAGAERELPAALRAGAAIHDCEGRWITPGLVDCHTHLVHAGDRAGEFARRLRGESYEQIAQSGGGIVASVAHLRAAGEDELVRQSLPRLDALLAEGATTIEIKSGYGLSDVHERKSLAAARRLARERAVRIRTTFLGAHAVPPEAAGDADAYVDAVTRMLPPLAADGLVDAVDAFCERIAFSAPQVGRVFDVAKALGLPVKLHADQLSNSHGAALAARYGALSADHLEFTDDEGVEALARAGTTAVLLPGAYYFLRETQRPPVERLRNRRVPMAVATDNNPGSSPLSSLLLAMNLAAVLFGLTVEECIAGVTREGARALGLIDAIGTLEVGKAADLAVWNVDNLAQLVQRMGMNPLHARVQAGATTTRSVAR